MPEQEETRSPRRGSKRDDYVSDRCGSWVSLLCKDAFEQGRGSQRTGYTFWCILFFYFIG